MSAHQRFFRIRLVALLAAFMLLQPTVFGAYTWFQSPSQGQTVATNPLKFQATVVWNASDTPLFNGNVTVSAQGYMGATAVSYTYTSDQPNRKGKFSGIGFPDGEVTFNPPLATGTQVDITYTASSQIPGMPPVTVSSVRGPISITSQ